MIENLQYYKQEFADKIAYYYYIEQNIYVSKKCYLSAFFILFGICFICFKVSSWLFVGINGTLLNYIDLFLVIMWLFLVKFNFGSLKLYANKVQVMKKVKIIYKNGEISELSNF